METIRCSGDSSLNCLPSPSLNIICLIIIELYPVRYSLKEGNHLILLRSTAVLERAWEGKRRAMQGVLSMTC